MTIGFKRMSLKAAELTLQAASGHFLLRYAKVIKTKRASVSFCCKSHRHKRAKIEILSVNSTHSG